jgi:hypothetical protein
MQQRPPWVLIATLIAGGGLSTLVQVLGAALPKYATIIVNAFAIVVAIAGLVVNYYQAINAPATSVVANPKTGNIPVVTPPGEPPASVVTTTSTEATTAPLASAEQVPPKYSTQ